MFFSLRRDPGQKLGKRMKAASRVHAQSRRTHHPNWLAVDGGEHGKLPRALADQAGAEPSVPVCAVDKEPDRRSLLKLLLGC